MSDELIDPRLNRVLTEYLEAVERGEDATPQLWLAKYPDLAHELGEFFASRERLAKLVDGHSRVSQETLPTGATREAVPTRVRYFGDYELLEEIARGGMGVVYRARQVNLKRIVALKMILAGQLASSADVKRFYAEAEAAAKLEHPNIVPIFEIGQAEGQHYFSMAFVEGESLAHRVARGVLSPRASAEIMHKVARAIAFAHVEGVIHRDLKPANILLDQNLEPHVTDFGLAKQLSGDPSNSDSKYPLTMTGQVLGTPGYMPPEQAAGRTKEIGPAADIYSFGAVLYCLITGRPPFQSATPLDTLRQVVEQDPVPPRQLNAAIPRDLETICMKCLEKETRRRYSSAQELADELGRFLQDEPILARPPGVAELGWRWLRKQKRSVALTALAVAATVILGAVGLGTWAWYLDWRLGYSMLQTDRPPLIAELLDEKGTPAAPSFTVPTQVPVAVPSGDYQLRISADARQSQTYQLSVTRGAATAPALFSFNLEDQMVRSARDGSDSLQVDRQFEIVQREGQADVLLLDAEGVKHPGWPGNSPAWSLGLTNNRDAVFQSAPGFRWPWYRYESNAEPTDKLFRPIVYQNFTPDLDGDGIEDVIVAARHQAWLLALSGRDGTKVLWFTGLSSDLSADPTKSQPVGNEQASSAVLYVTSLAPLATMQSTPAETAHAPSPTVVDLDRDGIAELIATCIDESVGSEQSKQLRRWIECLSGKSGKSLWRFDLEDSWFEFPSGMEPPGACRWMKSETGWGNSGGTSGGMRDDIYRQPTVRQVFGSWHPIPNRPVVARIGNDPIIVVVAGTHLLGINASNGQSAWQPVEIDAPLIRDPQLAELDGQNAGLELVLLKTTQNASLNSPRKPIKLQLDSWSLVDRRRLWQSEFVADCNFPSVTSMPAIAWPQIEDLDGDGRCDVIVTGQSSAPNSGRAMPWGELQVLEGATGSARWKRQIKSMDSQIDHFVAGPDIDADGQRDILVATLCGEKQDLFIDALSGKDGQTLWWSNQRLGPNGRWIDRIDLWERGQRGWPQVLVRTVPDTLDNDPPVVHSFSSETGDFRGSSTELSRVQFADADGDHLPELFALRGSERNDLQRGSKLQAIRGTAGETWRRFGRVCTAGDDYDGDGHEDLLRVDSVGASRLVAVSGRHGRKLWETALQNPRIDAVNSIHVDLDGDLAPDLLAYWSTTGSRTVGPETRSFPVEAVSGRTGKRLWSVNFPYCAMVGVLFTEVRDLDDDGVLEVIFSAITDWDYPHDRGSGTNQTQHWLAVVSGKNGELRWRKPLGVPYGRPGAPAMCNYEVNNTGMSPAIADLNGDQVQDLVLVSEAEGTPNMLELRAMSGRDGEIMWRRRLPQPLPLNTSTMLQNATTPVVADINRDTRPEILGLEYVTPQPDSTPVGQPKRIARVFALDGATGKEKWAWEREVNAMCGEVGVDAGRLLAKPKPLVLQRRLGPLWIAVGLWGWMKPGQIVVLNEEGKLVGETAVMPARDFFFRPWIRDMDGDGNDDMIAMNGDKLQIWRAGSEMQLAWERVIPQGEDRSIAGIASGSIATQNVIAVQHQNSVTGYLGETGDMVWTSVGPQPVSANGSPIRTSATLLDLVVPGTTAAGPIPPSVVFQFSDQVAVCQQPHLIRADSPVAKRSPVRSEKRNTTVHAVKPDPRWIRRPIWSPDEGGRLRGAFSTAWDMFLAFSLVILPGWLLLRAVRRGSWSLRALFFLPLLVIFMLAIVCLPAPRGLESERYSLVATRFLAAATFAPLFVFMGVLFRHLRDRRWYRILMWAVVSLVAGFALAVISQMQNRITLSPGESYSLSDWDVPLAWGFYAASWIATAVVVLIMLYHWARQLMKRAFSS